jgi:hypothetical protein
MTAQDDFVDELVASPPSQVLDGHFDRFMFNAHPADATSAGPVLIVGAGLHPGNETAAGYLLFNDGEVQRNLRFQQLLPAHSAIGPLRWEVVEPHKEWRLIIAPNEAGIELDARWKARAPAWVGSMQLSNRSDADTSFEHLFQSGRYSGVMYVDGVAASIDGWYGQRDRSRGVRSLRGGHGIHMWIQAQFPSFCVGAIAVDDRSGASILIDGAVMHESGVRDLVIGVGHDLRFSAGGELLGGTLDIRTESGATIEMDAVALQRGTYMSGGGYGGDAHGHAESASVYRLSEMESPAALSTSLTDKLCSFSTDGSTATGIFEIALSRSPAYRYRARSALRPGS